MILRQFNQAGIDAFGRYLAACKEDPTLPQPDGLLDEPSLTVATNPSISIDRRPIPTKADAAAFLDALLAPIPEQDLISNAGLWTWLTLFCFDDVCPVSNGRRRVKSVAFYVFEPKNSQRAYYHLLFVPWRVLRLAPAHSRLFLSGPVSVQDEVTREVMKRLYMTRIPCMFEVLDRLYWDERRSRARRGIVPREKAAPGDLRNRLPIRIRQLEMTYDLQSLNADQMIELLGAEFQHAGASRS
jgi:hypothetical protein